MILQCDQTLRFIAILAILDIRLREKFEIIFSKNRKDCDFFLLFI